MFKEALCDDVVECVKKLHTYLDEYDFEEEVEVFEYTDGIKMINDIRLFLMSVSKYM